MNKNDGRLSMGIVRREPERYHMKPYTFHIDKFAGRGCAASSHETPRQVAIASARLNASLRS